MFKTYLLAVVGVAILSLIVHLVLPEGKISKNVLYSFSLFTMVVLISPIMKLSNCIDFSNVTYSLDETFLNQNQTLENLIQSELENHFAGVKAKVVKNGETEYIFVDLSKVVLNNESEHINYYQAVKEILKTQFEIEDERVVIYG